MLFITNNSSKHQSFVYTLLNKKKTVLYQRIQFSISTVFCLQLNVKPVLFQIIQFKCQTVLFNTQIGPDEVLPLRASVDLRAMDMKGNTAFPKPPELLKPHHQIVQGTRWGGSYLCSDAVGVFSSPSRLGHALRQFYPFAVMHLVYSTALTDWAM